MPGKNEVEGNAWQPAQSITVRAHNFRQSFDSRLFDCVATEITENTEKIPIIKFLSETSVVSVALLFLRSARIITDQAVVATSIRPRFAVRRVPGQGQASVARRKALFVVRRRSTFVYRLSCCRS